MMRWPYVAPLGTPLYWRDEQSGVLPAAVTALFAHLSGNGPSPDPDQCALVRDYIVYVVEAPCWRAAAPGELDELRAKARTVPSEPAAISRFILDDCLELGIDPL